MRASPRTVACQLLLAQALCLTVFGCANRAGAQKVSKEQALKGAPASAAGWQEAISEGGRFRIAFPGQPTETDSEPGGLRGFKFYNGEGNWFALYADLTGAAADPDEAQLRGAYRESVASLTKRGARLLSQSEVRVNGRLGMEFVLEQPSAKSYMRVFRAGRRVYTVAADVTAADVSGGVPPDVRRFLDSFTFWD